MQNDSVSLPVAPKPATVVPKRRTSAGIGGASAVALMAAGLATQGLKPDEGKRNYTYLDIGGVPTYCFGHADKSAIVGTYHSDAECDATLLKDVQAKENAVLKCTPTIGLNPYILASATRLTFNIGEGHYCSSSIAKNFNAYHFTAGCAGFPAWRLVNGKPVAAILARRLREQAECQQGI